MSPGPGWRWARAIVNASTASSRVIRLRSAQPTTRRENRSRMTTRYSQPSRVQRYVMSDTQAVFGAATVKCRSRTLGDTGWSCVWSVVGWKRRFSRARRPCSLAKKAVAFFRMSRSIRSVFTSRRNCVSSARSSVVSGPLPLRPASTSAWTIQRRSAVSVRSSSRATVLTLFPLSRTTLIASALNSGENDRRRRFFPMTHSYRTFRAVRSVYETRGSPDFLALVQRFWHGPIWIAKHLRRGELWRVKTLAEAPGHLSLLQMLEWHACARNGWDYDTWDRGRFLEEWADPRAVVALREVFGRYDADDTWRALFASMELCRCLAT